jgi:predicted component of type VI protein secretion system
MNIPQYSLRYALENQATTSLPLQEGSVIVGSSPEAQIVLAAETVSRQHLRITVRGSRVMVCDLGSRNGSFLNGQALLPNQETDWMPGDTLRLPGASLDLSRLNFSPTMSAEGQALRLSATPESVGVNQPIQLRLEAQGSPQNVTLQGQSSVNGLDVQLYPTGGEVRPGVPFSAEARVQKRRPFLMGGRHRVRFAAMSVTGAFDTREVVVGLRPRYELLMLIPLFIVAGLVALFLRQPPPLAPTPTLAPTVVIPSRTPLPTPSPTATAEPALIPSALPPICQPQCAALGWPYYPVQTGDTLNSIGQAVGVSFNRLAEVNCLSNPNNITTGQRLCVPRLPSTDLLIQNQVTGTTDVGSPWPIMAQFTVTVTNISGSTAFGQVRVTSSSTGILIGSASGAGWTCTIRNLNALECRHPGPVLPGAALPGIIIGADYARDLTVTVRVTGDTNTGNNSASAFACDGGRCSAQEYWRQLCRTDPNAEYKLTPPAPGPLGGCAQWQALGL